MPKLNTPIIGWISKEEVVRLQGQWDAASIKILAMPQLDMMPIVFGKEPQSMHFGNAIVCPEDDDVFLEQTERVGKAKCPTCKFTYNIEREGKKTGIDTIIDQFIEDMSFDVLISWADLLGIEHDENTWIKDIWVEKENELRQSVGEGFLLIGRR